MRKIIIPLLFVIMCAVQLSVPALAIYDQEKIRSSGKEYKFETRPIDPTDPFRGSFITLYFVENQITVSDTSNYWVRGQEIFVYLNDSSGFAKIKGVSRSKPDSGDFVIARVSYTNTEETPPDTRLVIEYPFERFYLEESKAPKAEEYYNESQKDTTQPAYAVVRIKGGKASLIDVMINGKSIIDLVRESNEKLNDQ